MKSKTENEESETSCSENDKPEGMLGAFKDGFGFEIQGEKHVEHVTGSCVTYGVFLHRGTPFTIRLYNCNGYSAMIKMTVDNVGIGTFLLQPYSKCDIERPVDVAMAFIYGGPKHNKINKSYSLPADLDTDQNDQHVIMTQSTIEAVFQPEKNAKTMQAEFQFHQKTLSTKQLEVESNIGIKELLSLLTGITGDWIHTHKCVMIQWSTPEYDSPTEHVYELQNAGKIRTRNSKQALMKKFSLLQIDTLNLDIIYNDHHICMQVDTIPTIDHILEYVNINSQPLKHEQTIYIMTTSDRYLCSSTWVKKDITILNLLHKEELSDMPENALNLVITDKAPKDCFNITMRMGEEMFTLEVNNELSIRDCRLQLYSLGGPEPDAYRCTLLFAGILLVDGHNLLNYDITSTGVIDVVLRSRRLNRQLELKDPISVDCEHDVDTSELIKRADKESKKRAKRAHGKSVKQDDSKEHKYERGSRFCTSLKGKVKQQFIEVSALEVDERYSTTLAINILPKDTDKQYKRQSDVVIPERAKSRGICTLL